MMSATATNNPIRGMIVLGLLTVAIFGALAMVHEATVQRIEANRQRALWNLAEQMAGDAQLHTHARLPATGRPLRLADGRVLSWITTDGYGGPIELLALLSADGRLESLRTARHTETPGIGDFISGDTPWMRQFSGRDAGSLGNVDGRTGATITVTAVKRGVNQLFESSTKEN